MLQIAWKWAKIAVVPYNSGMCWNTAILAHFQAFALHSYIKCACSTWLVPLECFSMLETCLDDVTYPETHVVHSYNQHFWSISVPFKILANLIRNLFPQTLWETQNPCFLAVFEPLKIRLTQLQAVVKNFLEVIWPYNRYPGSTSGYKLSNALTRMWIGQLQRSLTSFVKKVFFTS